MRDWPLNPILNHQRAVFLDRDGTINVDTHYPHKVELLKFIPKAIDGLKIFAMLPLDIIVISNQAGIALKIFTSGQMSQFNEGLRSKIELAGGRIDAFYFCPHREPKDLQPGDSPCACSKPSPGMLLEAARDFELDLSKSFLIGDKTSDIAAGKKAGCFTILLKTGKAGKEEGRLLIEPKCNANNLFDAARIVKKYLEEERRKEGVTH